MLPYLAVRVGPPLLFLDGGVADGPYITSGHARLELGHAFEDGSKIEAGVTAGIFGFGAAGRADARIFVFRHVSLDFYASSGTQGFAWGGGAGIRY